MYIKRIKEVNKDLISTLSDTFKKGTDTGKSSDWNLENAADFVGDNNNIFLVAYEQDKVVGFLIAYTLQRMDDRKAKMFLYEIAVVKEMRRKGIGKTLVEKLKEEASHAGIDEIFVITERSNSAAVNLYKTTNGEESKDENVMFTYRLKK